MQALIQTKKEKEIVGRYDIVLFTAVVSLLLLGTLLIFSTTARVGQGEFDYYIKRHLVNLIIGAGLFVFATQIPTNWIPTINRVLLPISIILLILVLVPGIGMERGGARRWLVIPAVGVTVQPGEIIKLTFALYLSSYLAKRLSNLGRTIWSLAPLGAVYLLISLLLFAQPDVGSALLLGILLVMMLFVSGAKIKILSILFILLVIALMVVMALQPEKLARFVGWIFPAQTRLGEGYQLHHSQIIAGAGGLLGTGLGKGILHSLGYLPASENDFIFSVGEEEGGFVFVVGVVLIYWIIAFRGFLLSYRLDDNLKRLTAFTLTLFLTLPALIHMGVNLGLFPTKGIVAPFLSYGGSAIATELFAFGLLQRFHLEMTAGFGDTHEK